MNTSGKYVKHGLTKARVRSTWRWMMRRCYNPAAPYYSYYGGRGISVCERWHDLRNFFSDMGHPPEGRSLDRINTDGDYCPENCRWATAKQQARNTRRNRYLEFRGERKLMTDWAAQFGIRDSALHYRLSIGMPVEQALTKPLGRWAK